MNVLFALLCSLSCFAASGAPHSRFHVVIDAGHGGVDTGATHEHQKESDIVLSVSKKLEELLKNDSRFRSSSTRTKDHFLSLEERVELANKSQADLFLSIHVNWSEDTSIKGPEIYFQNQLPPDEESLFLASRENQGKKVNSSRMASGSESDLAAILEDLKRNTRIRQSGILSEKIEQAWPAEQRYKKNKTTIRQAPFFVISNLNMPSCLIELGYISNSKDRELLTNEDYQKKLASAIYNGLINYKELSDKSDSSRLN